MPISNKDTFTIEDAENLNNYHDKLETLQQENSGKQQYSLAFYRKITQLDNAFMHSLFNLVKAKFFNYYSVSINMPHLPEFRAETPGESCFFSRLSSWAPGQHQSNAFWMRQLGEALSPVPCYLELSQLEKYHLYLFFSILGNLDDRAFVKRFVNKHFDINALSLEYTGKHADMTHQGCLTENDFKHMEQGSSNALAKLAKAMLINVNK